MTRPSAPRHMFLQKADFYFFNYIGILVLLQACSSKPKIREEQLTASNVAVDTMSLDTMQANSIHGNLSLHQLNTMPTTVVLTGLAQHRLVTIYKSNVQPKSTRYNDRSSMYGEGNWYSESEYVEHFMPGLDLIYGYNLFNVAHYNLTTEKLNYLFDHPVLIKSLYFPSFAQDSLDKKPINRDYYLVSVYDADTNLDTLINKIDLRRIYHFNAEGSEKTALIPNDYSAVRSEYDSQNDVVYIFARQDVNHNGMIEKKEPLHIFWMNLKKPAKAVRLY